MKTTVLALIVLTVLAGCSDGEKYRDELTLPSFDEPELVSGESVWMNNCRACHLKGIAGAPSVFDGTAWSPRIAKGSDDLYDSALQGIPADMGWKMPPRGGNPRLSDEQVRQAVDYMLAVMSQNKTDPDAASVSSGASQVNEGGN